MKKRGKTRPTIGLLLTALNTSYETEIWKGVLRKAEKENVNLLCFSVETIDTSLSKTIRYTIFDLVSPRNVDGLICVTGSLCSFHPMDEIRGLLKQYSRIPIVSVGMRIEGVPSLLVNNAIGTERLLSHLIEKHGMRQIAFFRGQESERVSEQHYNAYRSVLKKYNIPFQHDLVVACDCERKSYEKAIADLLDKRECKADALVCTDEGMALAILAVLREKGIKVPDGIALCGCDERPESEIADPPLTTVRQPLFEMGERAVHMILSILGEKNVPKEVVVPTTLVIRRSCGCFPGVEEPPVFHITDINGKQKEYPVVDNAKVFISMLKKQCEKELVRMCGETHGSWSGRLFNGLHAALTAKRKEQFLCVLEDTFERGYGNRMSLSDWHRLLRMIFDSLDRSLKTRTDLDFLKQLGKESLLVAGLCHERLRLKKFVQSYELYTGLFCHFNREMMNAYTREILKKIITRELHLFDINALYLCLYERDERKGNFSVLFYAYGDFVIEKENMTSSLFPSEDLIPGGLYSPDTRYAFMVKPIEYEGGQIGFFLCDMGITDGLFYEALSAVLGNAFKVIELAEQVRETTGKLEFHRFHVEEVHGEYEASFSARVRRNTVDSLKDFDISPEKKTVLVVGDDIKTLSFLRLFLASIYNVFCATGAKAALKKLSVIGRPDIIISDIMMDGMDGYEFAGYLCGDEEYRDIPLIFLTTKSSTDEKLKGFSIGVVDYFHKPFLIEELMGKIDAIIRNRENLKSHYMKQVKKMLLTSFDEIESRNRSEVIMIRLSSLYDKYSFTGREREICELVVQGYLNKEIGNMLHISIRTVEFHLNNIYRKCHVQNKVELMHLLYL